MLSFGNTEIAFRYKSPADLRRSYFLYRMIASSTLVKIANTLFRFAHSLRFPLGWIVKPTVYKLFVGGETLEECRPTVRVLEKYNVKAILDYSVEGGESDAAAESTLEETLRTIINSAAEPNIPFAVFKPTAFGKTAVMEKISNGNELTPDEQKDAALFRRRIEILCKAAYSSGVPILIDAEDSWYQKCIDDLVNEMMSIYNKERVIVYNTFQMYRHDRLSFLRETISMAREGGYFAGLKFVRGAYMEKERLRAQKLGVPSPIYPDKEGTDNAYNEALRTAVRNIDIVTIFNGTHNEDSSLLLTKLMEEMGLEKNDPRIFFSQLYGMSDHISFNLASEGYNVAKYVPYGPVRSVMPYLLRRAEENTSIAGQTGRELRLLKIEKQRRDAIPK